jgi:signal transduction histidine kinase
MQLVSPRRIALSRMPEVFPPVAAGAASLLAIVSLVGWQFQIAALREPSGGFMSPNTALCILFLSAAIVLYRWREHSWARTTATFLECFVVLFCSLILFEHLTEISTGVSTIFFHDRMADWNIPTAPGRFAPTTAIAMILLSAALSIGHGNGRRELAQNITGMALLLGILAVIGHAYGIKSVFNSPAQKYMAFTTAISIVCLGLATLMAVVPDGWVSIILRHDAAGMLSRRILFITYVSIPLLGYIAVSYERNHWITPTVGVSLVVVAGLLILTSTVIRSAREIRRLERERSITEERLREAEKLAVTGRLAATLAHEVNNPLEAVMNILFLLGNDESLKNDSREFIKLAEEELLRVTHITRQTLAFYREPTSPVAVHLDDQVRQVVRIFQPKLNTKRIGLELSSNAAAEYLIHAGELKQIVTNLLANAIDAVGREGRIVIRIRETRSWKSPGDLGFRITIADDGTGISRVDRKRLFEPFFTTKGQRGTGLGLWVTQGLVTKHGGTLRMHTSTRGQRRGTTFSIFFPAVWQVTAAVEENKKAAFRTAG